MTIQEITKEVWDILVELSQAPDYAAPEVLPKLRERAEALVQEMIKQDENGCA